jgi:NAD+ kinase
VEELERALRALPAALPALARGARGAEEQAGGVQGSTRGVGAQGEGIDDSSRGAAAAAGPPPAAPCAGVCRSHSELCLDLQLSHVLSRGGGGAGVGPAAAAARAAAGVRHWLAKPRAASSSAAQARARDPQRRSAPASCTDLTLAAAAAAAAAAAVADGGRAASPPTPPLAPRGGASWRGGAAGGGDVAALSAFTADVAHALLQRDAGGGASAQGAQEAAAEAPLPPALDDDDSAYVPAPRAGFRLLCTLPHEEESSAASASDDDDDDDEDDGDEGSARRATSEMTSEVRSGAAFAECECSPLVRRDVAAVLPRATALSEDVLRAAALASSGAVSARAQRRAQRRRHRLHKTVTGGEGESAHAAASAGVALQLQWLAPPRNVLLVCKPDGGAEVEAGLARALALLRGRGCAVFVEPTVAAALRAARAPHADDLHTWHAPTHDDSDSDSDETASAASACGCGAVAPPRRPPAPPPPRIAACLDLVVTLGGDGTVLWVSHLLGDGPAPPILSFSLGSLCFMTPFAARTLPRALHAALAGGFHLTLRHRLTARVIRADGTRAGPPRVVLNEVVIDRGASPYLTNLECFCDGAFVTRVQGDGLIIATPSGSTAYNLAAAGSMVHPGVPGILFTPICPHSLSFRPLVFPVRIRDALSPFGVLARGGGTVRDALGARRACVCAEHGCVCVCAACVLRVCAQDTVRLRLQVPAGGRAPLWASFDGRVRVALAPGDSVRVRLSRWPMPTVCAGDATADWFASVRETLHWNERRVQGVTKRSE